VNQLSRLLREPAAASRFDTGDWDRLLVQVRAAGVAARLHARLVHSPEAAALPEAVADVLRGTAIRVGYLQRRALHELSWLAELAAEAAYPVVLLKGIAYLLADLPAAPGRALSDIDVLVPRKALPTFEQALAQRGWAYASDLSDYDERYYREWSHELPPLRRPGGQFELDVHHALVQPTSRAHFDAAVLFECLQPVTGTPFYRLSNEDLVLHSAVHLVMSDELRGGIGDVWDITLLCRHFSLQEPGFWSRLAGRADDLGVGRPVMYALGAAKRLFGLEVPADDWQRLASARGPWPIDRFMRSLVLSHLAPPVPGSTRPAMAERCLYVRSHWVRMPFPLLIRHLFTKGIARKQWPLSFQ